MHAAFVAWLAIPHRPRTIPQLVASGVCCESNARRWRKRFSWDARAAAWDLDQAGAPLPVAEVPGVDGIEDPILRARAWAQGHLMEYVTILDGIARKGEKAHLRAQAALALLEVAGLAKVSRPKLDTKDPLRAARLSAERLADHLTPDQLRDLLADGDDPG